MSVEHWWNDTNRGKQKHWEKNLSQCYFCTTHLTWTEQGSNPGIHGQRSPDAYTRISTSYREYSQSVSVIRAIWFTLTKSITPSCRVLLEKLTVSQSVKKLPAFYETRWFITAFTRALSSARSNQTALPSHLLKINFNIVFPSIPRSSKWCLPVSYPTNCLYAPLLSPTRATCSTHLIIHLS